jgi:non-canonical (house-cleaning) NTP pyrophosphatase
VSRLAAGVELGDVIDEILGEVGTKRKEGAIGFLTRGIMTRKDFYAFGLICALVPFLNKGFFDR